MLVTCPECGREISDKATACPQRGYPVTAAQKSDSASKADSTLGRALGTTNPMVRWRPEFWQDRTRA